MNTRYVAAIIAALVLGAVIVAGCTSSTTTSPTPSTATSTAGTRDAFLERYVASLERELRNNTTVSLWVSKWQNGSAVSIEATFRNVTSNQDVNLNRTVIRFASTDDATSYVESNYANAPLTTNFTKITSLPYRAYELTKGSAPTVYRAWTQVQIRDLRWTTVQQLDSTIVIDSVSAIPSSSAVIG
jgi:outer membrane murein-binding lipoprotein Lpp